MPKIKIEDVTNNCELNGWKVISEKYINLDTIMEYKCPIGHSVFKTYKQLRKDFICPVCEKNPIVQSQNLSIKAKGKEFRILALDQSTQLSGWCVFDGKELIKFGKISISDEYGTIERIMRVKEWFINIIDAIEPDLILFEDIQLQEFGEEKTKYNSIGVTTYKTLAFLLGVLQLSAYECKIDFKIVHSNTWRNHVGVKGKYRTDKKRSAQLIILNTYGVKVSEDEADAICIGIYGASAFHKEQPIIKW